MLDKSCIDQARPVISPANLANLVRLGTVEIYETDHLVSHKQCDCLAWVSSKDESFQTLCCLG